MIRLLDELVEDPSELVHGLPSMGLGELHTDLAAGESSCIAGLKVIVSAGGREPP